MRALNAVRRILLLLLLIPVIAIALDALLRAFGAQKKNPIVSTVRDVAEYFILDPFKTVFPDQGYVQTALVALVAYGILALLIVFLFRGLSSMVSTKPPQVRSGPAKKPKPTAKAAPAKESAPATDATSAKPPAETTTVSKSGTGSASGASAEPSSDKDGQPTSG